MKDSRHSKISQNLISLGLFTFLSACQTAPISALREMGTTQELSEFRSEPYQIMLSEPSSRQLAVLKQSLGAVVIDQIETSQHKWVLLQMQEGGLPASLYQDLPLAWKNQEIQNMEPSVSKELYQTLVLAEDIRQSLDSAEQMIQLNVQAELPKAINFNDQNANLGIPEQGWWRRETGVERAWDFSLGTTAKVAWIDIGFKRHHPEIERRLILTGDNNQTIAWNSKAPNNIELPKGDHGAASIMVGFAERDNGIPSVGVAPNAGVIPYVAGSVWEAARALKAAAAQNPDVIGMNLAWPMYPRWEGIKDYADYLLLKEVLTDLGKNPQLSLVVPAHNYGEPIVGGPREWFPISLTQTQPQGTLLGVGGVEFKDAKNLQVWFNPNILTGYNSRGSNYGEGLIWAPSVALDIAGSDPGGILPNSMNGTSASAPFMAGVLALLKSRCRNLPAHKLIEILLQTGKPLDASQILGRTGATVPFIQADLAIKACIKATGQEPVSFQSQLFKGKLAQNSDGSWVLMTPEKQFKLLATLSQLQTGYPNLLLNKTVLIQGWQKLPGFESEELEVLSLVAE
jgi:hypothetical protein